MRIVTNLEEYTPEGECAAAIGKFDGVHLGHRRLLSEILREKAAGRKALVFTFDPSPEVFFGHGPEKELSTREEKHRLFEQLGIDVVVEFPFTQETAKMPPEAFVRDILCRRLHAALVAAGTDLSFGESGRGDFALLKSLSSRYHYTARQIEKVQYRGVPISSTLIRGLVAQGRMEEVEACLGAPYTVLGTVQHGNEIGRTIDIPTINQLPEEAKLLPPFGVYYSAVRVDGRLYAGMTNIGIKPTIREKAKRVTVETHLYDFAGNLYGKLLGVSLLTYRRPERKFSGIDELKKAMESDLAAGREYFAARES